MRIPHPQKKVGTPPSPHTMLYLGGQRGVFSKVVLTSGMASEGLGEMFEGDYADMCP